MKTETVAAGMEYRKRNAAHWIAACASSLLLMVALPAAAQLPPFDWEATNGFVTITGYVGVGPFSVTIPSTIDGLPVTAIGFGVFRGSLLTSVTIPDSIITIGDYTFDSCVNLTQVAIPDSVTSIGVVAFRYCGLTSITLPNSITNLGAYAFEGCTNLTSVTLPDSITSLADWVFHGCESLAAITLPSGLTSIGNEAFYYCQSLANITIPPGVTNLGYWAFYYCESLIDITIPGSVATLGTSAFTACYSLANVFFEGDAPSADSSVFSQDTYATVYYLPGSKGWGATFAGLPAVLWNPTVVSLGVRNGQLRFDITGGTNLPVVVEASTNLTGGPWVPVQSGSLTNGLLHFSDPQSANYPARFYRLRWP